MAGINYAAAGFINATIVDRVLNTTFNTALFGPINGQLVTMGILMLIQLAMNIMGISLVSLLNQVSVWWHIVIVAAVVILIFLTGKPDQSGLTLFAIEPLDTAGGWDNNLGVVHLTYGPAVSYPVVLGILFRCSRPTGLHGLYASATRGGDLGALVARRGHLPFLAVVRRWLRFLSPNDPPARRHAVLSGNPSRMGRRVRTTVAASPSSRSEYNSATR